MGGGWVREVQQQGWAARGGGVPAAAAGGLSPHTPQAAQGQAHSRAGACSSMWDAVCSRAPCLQRAAKVQGGGAPVETKRQASEAGSILASSNRIEI